MLRLADEAATLALGAAIAPLLRPGDVIALQGELGAGKTTLARGLLAALGLEEEAPSPSFAIVQAYAPPEVRLPLWHVDLYRLDDAAADTEELGLDEALEDGALLIEWPERLGSALWPQTLRLSLDVGDDGVRGLTWAVPPAWEGRWPPPHTDDSARRRARLSRRAWLGRRRDPAARGRCVVPPLFPRGRWRAARGADGCASRA